MKNEEKKTVELNDNQLEQVSGGTVKIGDKKPEIKGLEADIEGELNIIHYEDKEP